MISSARVTALLECFPILSDNRGLKIEDFSKFSQSYEEILRKHLPTAEQVNFLHGAGQLAKYFPQSPLLPELTDLFEGVKCGEKMVGLHSQCLMLPFALRSGEIVVALVSRADPVFIRKVSEDWLIEVKLAVEREFLLLKEARVDIQTGLLNISNLCYLLDTYSTTRRFHLILVELPPKRASFQYVLRHSQKCATALLDFFQSDTVVHYLGQCTFALVLQNSPVEGKAEVESALVAYLKREGCHKIHIGSSFSDIHGEGDEGVLSGRRLLDEAWTALRHAAQRGPFSFCDYGLLAYPESHPLRPPEKNLLNRLNRLWRNADSFCLIQFHNKSDLDSAKTVMMPHLDRGAVFTDGADVFVYLEGVGTGEALAWVNERIQKIDDVSLRNRMSAGISGYPYADFKKPEIVFNCRKALIHAAFYGEPSVAVFDSVSMNISGDIYFGDGDLAKAVLEYRRGLKCDELNVNLHNSLGVALAMMGKRGAAMQSFQLALDLDERNFMALYNLGLAEQVRGNKERAFAYFESALDCCSEGEDEGGLADDLQLQLGILAGDLGRYSMSLAYLLPWYERNEKNQRADRVLFHLGCGYHGVGENRKAMVVLQKALQFNEFDDRAMNLLGMVYFEESEGDEIALSLCRKSVELEPSNLVYRVHLAEVQLRCQMVREARENLSRCLRNRRHKAHAQLLLGQSYSQEGKKSQARAWLQKVLAQEHGQPELNDKARSCLQGMD